MPGCIMGGAGICTPLCIGTPLPIGGAYGCLMPSPIFLTGLLGGASALMVTIFSPLSKIKPRDLFISLSFGYSFIGISSPFPSSGMLFFIFFALIMRYSSVSERTKFICLSKAISVPTRHLES